MPQAAVRGVAYSVPTAQKSSLLHVFDYCYDHQVVAELSMLRIRPHSAVAYTTTTATSTTKQAAVLKCHHNRAMLLVVSYYHCHS
eukprot:8063-Heterococcus_DN1.PRE.2